MANFVVITGASRGIGLALTKKYVERGDRVTALCRSASPELMDLKVEVIENVDVTNLTDLQRVREQLKTRKIQILINNAGVMESELIEDFSEVAFEKMRRQFEVNSLGPLKVTAALLDNLDKGSKIALITSRMGSIADNTSGKKYGYRMSKAALNAAGVSLSHDLKEKGIAVGLYHPGWVQTDMTGHSGQLTPDECASNLIVRIGELSLQNSGVFYHSNGEKLPW